MLKRGVEEGKVLLHDIEETAKPADRYVLLEIFAGMAPVSAAAGRRAGRWEVRQPLELVYGDDLRDPALRSCVLDELREHRPDLVALAPPCGPWSLMQNLNDPAATEEKRREHRVFWLFTRDCWDVQCSHGGLVLTEQPAGSRALELAEMTARPQLARARISQCAFGLRDPVSLRWYRKPTYLDVNDAIFAKLLEVDAQCTHESSEHEPIQGNVRVQGRSQKRTLLAGAWTAEMADHILDCAEAVLQLRGRAETDAGYVALDQGVLECEAYVVTGETAPGAHPEAEAQEEMRKLFKKFQEEEDLRRGDYRSAGQRYGHISFRGEALAAPAHVRNAVAKLHGVLVHPSNRRLERMLILAGGSKQILAAARGLHCQICERVSEPRSSPKATARSAHRFNMYVGGDTFFVKDVAQKTWAVTHFVDGFCTMQMGGLAATAGSESSANIFYDRWLSIFGPCDVVFVDGGPEFRGRFHRLCEMFGIVKEVLPTHAKWKAGLAERHGAVAKLMLLRVIQELCLKEEWELRYAVGMVFQAKNRMSRSHGWSPIQVTQGRDAVIPSSLMQQLCSGEIKDRVNELVDQDDAFRVMERIRVAAQEAFLWLDANDRIRTALNARSRPPGLAAVSPGMQVCFQAPPGAHRRLQDAATAQEGPAVVVARDGPDTIWVKSRGRLVRVALENVRLPTEEELLSAGFITDILQDLAKEMGGTSRPRGYEDWTEEDEVPAPGRGEEEAPTAEPPPAPPPPPPRDPPHLPADAGHAGTLASLEAEPREPVGLAPEKRQRRSDADAEPVEDDRWAEASRRSVEVARRLDLGDRAGLPAASSSRGPNSEEDEPSDWPLDVRMEFFQRSANPQVWEEARRSRRRPVKDLESVAELGAASAWEGARAALEESSQGIASSSAQRASESGEPNAKQPRHDVGVVEWAPAWAVYHMEVWQDFDALHVQMHGERGPPDGAVRAVEEAHQELPPAPPVAKGRGEVSYSRLSRDDQELVEQAMIKQIKNHLDLKAIMTVPKGVFVPRERTVTSRFVITQDAEKKKFKARWCVGGHNDPDLGQYRTESPTSSFLGHMMVIFVSVQLAWPLWLADVSAAFLQGVPLPRDEPVYVRLPRPWPDVLRSLMKEWMGGEARDDVVQAVKGLFGLAESPRLWYMEVSQYLRSLGFKELITLRCVFAAYREGKLIALVSVHVDDFLGAGTADAEELWQKLRDRYTFGKWQQASDGVRHIGRDVKQHPSGDVTIDLTHYTQDMELVPVDENAPDDEPLGPEGLAALRAANGRLGWAAREGRPDLSYGVSRCQQALPVATKETLVELNTVIRRARRPRMVTIKPLGCELKDVVFLAATDGSLGNMPRQGSQVGYAILAGHPKVLEESAPVCLLEWCSARCKRIVRSSLGVEVCAAALGYEHVAYVRATMAEIVHESFDVRHWHDFAKEWRVCLVIDARTAFDALESEGLPGDRRVALDMAALREDLKRDALRSLVRWVPGPQQLADGLTKRFGNAVLEATMAGEGWSLREQEEVRLRREYERNLRKKGAAAARPAPSGVGVEA